MGDTSCQEPTRIFPLRKPEVWVPGLAFQGTGRSISPPRELRESQNKSSEPCLE